MPDPVAHSGEWARDVRARLSTLHLSPAREHEIVEELSQHLEDRWRELVAGGASPEEATRLALADFRDGGVLAKYMAALRQAHASPPVTLGASSGRAFGDLWQDVAYAARVFSKRPAFTAAAVLTLALGIGTTTAIFSVVHGVLLKPLPFHESGQLVSLVHVAAGWNFAPRNHGPATYFTARDHQQLFEEIGAWDFDDVSIVGGGDPEQVEALFVSDTMLPVLRVEPILGRLFTVEDDAPGAPLLRVLLTYGYWQRRYGGAPDAIGQPLQVNGRPAEIVGVLPASFVFRRATPAVLLPMQLDRATAFKTGLGFGFGAVGRRKPGVTLAQANSDMARWLRFLPPAFDKADMRPRVLPLVDDGVPDRVRRTLWILLAAAGVVLLIACGNVANLYLVWAEGRQQEIALRSALGASRGRITRALLSESLLLALAGGAAGLALAQIVVALLRAMAPAGLPRVHAIGLDPTVLVASLAISVLSAALFGLIAVLSFSTPGIAMLKEGGRSSGEGPRRHRTRHALVVSQIALALTLLIVSGLMIRTSLAMHRVQPGFIHPEDVQTFQVTVPQDLVDDPKAFARTHDDIARRLAEVPGVISVGLSSSITLDGEDNGNTLDVEGVPMAPGTPAPLRRFKSVGPGYFDTMGNALVAGRSMTWTEIHEERPVIVISETLAREYWGEAAKAIGRRVRAGEGKPWRVIVGVAGDERDDGLHRPPTAIVYWPLANDSYQRRTISYVVRSSRVGTLGFLRELQHAVWSVDPNLPLGNAQTLAEIQAGSMAQTSFAMVMLAVGAGVALLIALVGVYGVVSYIASERTHEVGIRLALGAQRGDVRRLFLRHGLALALAGIVLGLGSALLLTPVMSALLYGIGPTDPVTYAGVAIALGAVTLVATYLPARRASRVPPIIALRSRM